MPSYIVIPLIIALGGAYVFYTIRRDGKDRGWISNGDREGFHYLLPQDKAEAMRCLRVREETEDYELDVCAERITFFGFWQEDVYQMTFTTLGRQTVLTIKRKGLKRSQPVVRIHRFCREKLQATPVDAGLFQRLRYLPIPSDATPFLPPCAPKNGDM